MGQQRRGMRWWRRGPHREVGAHDALQGRVVDGAERRVEAKLRWQHAERVDAWQTDPSASFQHVRPDAAARGHASQGQRTVAGVRVADGDVVVAHRLRGRRLHLPDQQCFLRAVAGGAATARTRSEDRERGRDAKDDRARTEQAAGAERAAGAEMTLHNASFSYSFSYSLLMHAAPSLLPSLLSLSLPLSSLLAALLPARSPAFSPSRPRASSRPLSPALSTFAPRPSPLHPSRPLPPSLSPYEVRVGAPLLVEEARQQRAGHHHRCRWRHLQRNVCLNVATFAPHKAPRDLNQSASVVAGVVAERPAVPTPRTRARRACAPAAPHPPSPAAHAARFRARFRPDLAADLRADPYRPGAPPTNHGGRPAAVLPGDPPGVLPQGRPRRTRTTRLCSRPCARPPAAPATERKLRARVWFCRRR